MNFSKMLAGILAFIVALGAAIALTKYYSTPTPPAPPPPVAPTEAPAPPASTPHASDPSQISFKPQMVVLDFAARQTHATLAIERNPSRPAPEKLWVRTYFFSTEAAGKVWATETVEIKEPFAGGMRANINASSACSWCTEPNAPRGGYYARVIVSAVSKEATRVAEDGMDTNIPTAAPVVVQEAAKGRR